MSKYEVGSITGFIKSHINWKIPKFSDIEFGCRIWSPKFGDCQLGKYDLVPSNWCLFVDKKWIHLTLTSEKDDKIAADCVRVGVINESGREISSCNCVWNPHYRRFDGINLVKEEELTLREVRAIPHGHLRLFCEIPLKPSRQIFDDDTQNGAENGLKNLSQDFKDLFTNKKDTDLTIKVQDREFHVHRIILRARSPVFDDMLSLNAKESEKNTIEIEDCSAEVFEEFLLFIYSGRSENITCGNACKLYDVADKYIMPNLKNVCIGFLKKNLSLDNICDVIFLARKQNETELVTHAMSYFAKNMDAILKTSNWLLVLTKKPVEASELCTLALKLGFKKKSPYFIN